MSADITSPNLPLVRESGGRLISFSLAAGQNKTLTQRGTQYYLNVCTLAINVRARGKNKGAGDYNLIPVGKQIISVDAFDFIDLQNPNSVPVTVSIWVGFDDFVDRTLILANATQPQVLYPTYPVANAAAIVQIRDLSGTQFEDLNGNLWLALFRVCIYVFNLDTGTTTLLYAKGGSGSSPAGGVIYPAPLPIRFDVAGDFDINLGGATINMIVSEVYQAIPATS